MVRPLLYYIQQSNFVFPRRRALTLSAIQPPTYESLRCAECKCASAAVVFSLSISLSAARAKSILFSNCVAVHKGTCRRTTKVFMTLLRVLYVIKYSSPFIQPHITSRRGKWVYPEFIIVIELMLFWSLGNTVTSG